MGKGKASAVALQQYIKAAGGNVPAGVKAYNAANLTYCPIQKKMVPVGETQGKPGQGLGRGGGKGPIGKPNPNFDSVMGKLEKKNKGKTKMSFSSKSNPDLAATRKKMGHKKFMAALKSRGEKHTKVAMFGDRPQKSVMKEIEKTKARLLKKKKKQAQKGKPMKKMAASFMDEMRRSQSE